MGKWAAACFILAGVLLAAGVIYGGIGFNSVPIGGQSFPGEPVQRAQCSAPVLQLVDPPKLSVDTGDKQFVVHDVPQCKEVGRMRILTSVALLIASALAATLGVVLRARRTQDLDDVGAVPQAAAPSKVTDVA